MRSGPNRRRFRPLTAGSGGEVQACAGVLFALALAAQAPEAVVRGTLVDLDGGASGVLSVRAGDHHVHCFRLDSATAVQREGREAAVSELNKGDTVEVVVGAAIHPRLRYARLVRIIGTRAAVSRVRARRPAGAELRDDLFPRGNLTLSGVVKSLHAGRMVLATRAQGETGIRLREDTRYFRDGREDGFSGLRVNARVFVRAGRNLARDIEAYQVMWGGILKPEERGRPESRPARSGAGTAGTAPEQADSPPPAGVPDWNQLLY